MHEPDFNMDEILPDIRRELHVVEFGCIPDEMEGAPACAEEASREELAAAEARLLLLAEDAGDFTPLVLIAERLLAGDQAPHDPARGEALLQTLADKAVDLARICLAERLLLADGVKPDEARALALLGSLIESGKADWVFMLGKALCGDHDGAVNPQAGVLCLEMAAKAGCTPALVALGDVCLDGAHGVPQDRDRAFRLYHRAAEAEDRDAWERVGYCLFEGFGTLKNRGEALFWYEKAAAVDRPLGWYMLGQIHSLDPERLDAEKAVHAHERSAKLGMPVANLRLGILYLRGMEGLAPDPRRAYGHFLQAARSGDPNALEWLAWCRRNGAGRRLNQALSLRYTAKAAKWGLRDSQYLLGLHFASDRQLPDLDWAVRWLRAAADQGHAGAQMKLGILLVEGVDVPRDPSLGRDLIRKAAEAGLQEAVEWERRMGARNDSI